ncbi:MAG: hypothetical protein JNM63_07535, partial [Spirochaetia bacterium]|nr:hypothetical protein [Spirochaetia bacterium]
GRLLATLPGDPSGKKVWNVRDKNGHPVAPGIYNGVITSGSERRSVKIMILP